MARPPKGRRFGGSPAHERLILANLATALFRHGRITTTEAKAKRLRPFAETLITKAKRGDLHARRQVLTVVRDRDVSTHLFDELGPRYATRPGGYTRIVKAAPRKGDAAAMAIIELVEPMPERAAAPAASGRRRAAKEESVAVLAGDTEEPPASAAGGSADSSASADSADSSASADSPEETGGKGTDSKA